MSAMVKSTPASLGDGQQVQDRVGRAAHGDVERHRVLEGLEGGDRARQHRVVARRRSARCAMLDDAPAPPARRAPSDARAWRRCVPLPGQSQAERLVQAVHAVRGEHARAGAAGGAGRALDARAAPRRSPWRRSPAIIGSIRSSLRTTGCRRGRACPRSCRPPSARPRRRSSGCSRRMAAISMPGVILSQFEMQTSASAHVGVHHVLDAVGDQLAAGQRVEHPVVAHRDAVVDGDGVELDAPAARRVDHLLHPLPDVVQVHVAGDELGEAVGDGDDRLREVVVGHAGGAPQGPGARHVAPGRRRPAAKSLHAGDYARSARVTLLHHRLSRGPALHRYGEAATRLWWRCSS